MCAKCPVCNGRQTVPAAFYTSQTNSGTCVSMGEIECRSCKGTGVIWGPGTPALSSISIPSVWSWPPATLPSYTITTTGTNIDGTTYIVDMNH